MIRFLIFLFLFYLGLRAIKALVNPGGRRYQDPRHPHGGTRSSAGSDLPVTDEMLKDPHCGVYFPRKEGVPLNMDGNTLLFCSTRCREAYQREHPQ
ncbi:MAG: hypothetical protein QNJ22_02375 [Desulfosarcinaceae bacterium]|nr:hypothetical protein [Desulfosarcinaceae bacterium]